MAKKAREVRIRLAQNYPGAIWPNGKAGDYYPEWINIPQLERMLRECDDGFQILDWSDDDINVDRATNKIAIVQIVESRKVK